MDTLSKLSISKSITEHSSDYLSNKSLHTTDTGRASLQNLCKKTKSFSLYRGPLEYSKYYETEVRECRLLRSCAPTLEVVSATSKHERAIGDVLLLHGAWCWRNFVKPLQENGYNVHAMSLRGHGNSDSFPRFFGARFSDYVQDLKDVSKALDLKDAFLIAHSLGCLVTQKALEGNHNYKKVCFLAPVPPNGLINTTLNYAFEKPFQYLKTFQGSIGPVVENPKLFKETFLSESISDDVARLYFSFLKEESYLAYLTALNPHLVNNKLLQGKKLNVSVIGAENDKLIPLKDIHFTALSYFTKAEIIKDIAHDLMIDTNWRLAFEQVLENFSET